MNMIRKIKTDNCNCENIVYKSICFYIRFLQNLKIIFKNHILINI